MKDHFILALKNLRRRGIRSWLTLLGIFIGIASVISLISLGTALQTAVLSQFPIESTEIITVSAGGLSNFGPIGTTGAEPLKKSYVDEIERLGRVEFAIGRNIRGVSSEFNNVQSNSFTATLPSGDKKRAAYDFLGIEIYQGRFLQDDDDNGILIGYDLADSEKNGYGRAIRVGDRIILNGEAFRVIGIIDRKGSFIIDRVILINHNSLERLLGYGDEIDNIIVKVRNMNEMDETKEDIERLMRRLRNVREGQEDFEVSTPQASLASINQILTGIQIFIVIIASISIVVGAIGISNTMATAVLERRKEIGIMKAIGARNGDIFYQFFIEAGLLGFIGGLIGVLVGLGVGYLGVYSLQSFLGISTKMAINFPLIIFALVGSFAIGSLSGTIPALNAAKQNPVDALSG